MYFLIKIYYKQNEIIKNYYKTSGAGNDDPVLFLI